MTRGQGLRIRMRRVPGMTPKGTLKVPYYFQCPPMDEFSVAYGHQHGKYTTIDGEYSRRGGRNLITTSFRTLIVEYGGFVVEHDYDVGKLVDRLQILCHKGYPFDLLCTHAYNQEPELHMDAVLETVTVVENANELDARYLDLAFCEYRDPVVKRRRIKGDRDSKAKGRRPGRKSYPIWFQLKKDGTFTAKGVKVPRGKPLTLELMATLCYGKASYAKYIAQANKLSGYGRKDHLIKHPRFKAKGGKLVVHEPPIATTALGVKG